MKNTYQLRDDFYHDRVAGEIERDQANLKRHRVRYTNEPRSIMEKRVPFRKPYFFSSGTSSSLVVA